jgi:hypothetical protein
MWIKKSNVAVRCEWFQDIKSSTPMISSDKNVESFVDHLQLAFMLTGVSPSVVTILTNNATKREVYEWIYDVPLPPSLEFVEIDACFCNMGNCGRATDFNMVKLNDRTSRSVFQLWGCKPAPVDWMQYPDSVFLYIRKFDMFPETVGHEKTRFVPTFQLDQEKDYYTFHYSR